MRKILIPVAMLTVAAGFVGLNWTAAADDDAKATESIQWTDYESGMKAAKESGKPAMIDFTASWCVYCRKLEKDVYTQAGIIELSKQFVCIKVDSDTNAKLVQQYAVRGLPTIVFTGADAKEIHRVVGYREAESFREAMETALKNAK